MKTACPRLRPQTRLFKDRKSAIQKHAQQFDLSMLDELKLLKQYTKCFKFQVLLSLAGPGLHFITKPCRTLKLFCLNAGAGYSNGHTLINGMHKSLNVMGFLIKKTQMVRLS